MIPIQKVKDIISKHSNLEKELSSGSIDPKIFAKKSKVEFFDIGFLGLIFLIFCRFEQSEKIGTSDLLSLYFFLNNSEK